MCGLEDCIEYDPNKPLLYRWVVDENGWFCDNFNKFYKLKKQQSWNDGETWVDVDPPEFLQGDLMEENSSDCDYGYTWKEEEGVVCLVDENGCYFYYDVNSNTETPVYYTGVHIDEPDIDTIVKVKLFDMYNWQSYTNGIVKVNGEDSEGNTIKPLELPVVLNTANGHVTYPPNESAAYELAQRKFVRELDYSDMCKDKIIRIDNPYFSFPNLETYKWVGEYNDLLEHHYCVFDKNNNPKDFKAPKLNLANVYIRDGITEIDMSIFNRCQGVRFQTDAESLNTKDLRLEGYYPYVNVAGLFMGSSNLKEIDLSNCRGLGNVSYATSMFSGCTNLEFIDFGNILPSFMNANTRMYDSEEYRYLFNGCTNLKKIRCPDYMYEWLRVYPSSIYNSSTSFPTKTQVEWELTGEAEVIKKPFSTYTYYCDDIENVGETPNRNYFDCLGGYYFYNANGTGTGAERSKFKKLKLGEEFKYLPISNLNKAFYGTYNVWSRNGAFTEIEELDLSNLRFNGGTTDFVDKHIYTSSERYLLDGAFNALENLKRLDISGFNFKSLFILINENMTDKNRYENPFRPSNPIPIFSIYSHPEYIKCDRYLQTYLWANKEFWRLPDTMLPGGSCEWDLVDFD